MNKPSEEMRNMWCIDCGGSFLSENSLDTLCRHCKEDRNADEAFQVEEAGAEGNRRRVADEEDKHGQSHQRLLKEDEAYREAANLRERGDPVAILKNFFFSLGRLIPGQPNRKHWWPTDVVVFFGYYGAERILGNSLALFLPKLLCFPHDKIYIGRSKLSASRGLTHDWGGKMIKRLLRPWCVNCCKTPTSKNTCAPGQHNWQPALFFIERVWKKRQRYYLPYLRPNKPAFKSLECFVCVPILLAVPAQRIE